MGRKWLCFLMILSVCLCSACAGSPGRESIGSTSDSGKDAFFSTALTSADNSTDSVSSGIPTDEIHTTSYEQWETTGTTDLSSSQIPISDGFSDAVTDEDTDDGSDAGNVSSSDSVTSAPVQSSDPVSNKTTATHNTSTSSLERPSSAISGSDDTSNTDTPPDVPEKVESDLVIACDQAESRVVIYDLEKYVSDLEDCELWSFAPGLSSAGNMSGVKYRENTVFGDVVIMCASSGYASIVTYPGKRVVWYTKSSGMNPHSVEILPDGNLVVASSSGSTLRLYYTSELVKNSNASVSYRDFVLSDAHGVLWDPQYQLLWGIGAEELKAYSLSGTGTSLSLTEVARYTLPSPWGHDLSADFRDKNALWLTVGNAVYRFNKVSKTFSTSYSYSAILNRSNVKGFGNNRNASYFYCFPNGGAGRDWSSANFASWCTDTIRYAYYNANGQFVWKDCKSSTSAFYKVYSFQGQYQ